jgi:hypothetical protein
MAETVQVLKGTSATIRGLFYVDGVLTDAGSTPTATITNPDGTIGPASGAISHPGTGTYSFVLAATSTAEVTFYTVTWAASIGGQPQTITTFVEVVGEFLFTLAEARQVDGGAITLAIADDQKVLDKRTSIADRLQRVCGVSFFPRFARETRNGDGSWQLRLNHHRASKLLTVKVNGVAKDIAGYTLHSTGILEATSNYVYAPSGWFTPGRGNVVVEYVHGWDQVPGPVRDAALKIARMQLVPSNIGDRATSIATDQGTIFLSTAGRGTFQPFGIPEVDAALRDFDESRLVVG